MPDVYFPRDQDDPVSVGHYSLAAGDVPAAERASRDALRANPHSVPARIDLAAALELSGNEHEALLEYLEAAGRSRSNLRALAALGSVSRCGPTSRRRAPERRLQQARWGNARGTLLVPADYAALIAPPAPSSAPRATTPPR